MEGPSSALPTIVQVKALESPGDLLTIQMHGPNWGVSGSVGLGCSPEIYFQQAPAVTLKPGQLWES